MYFDYTATTPMDPEIIDVYCKVQKEYYANTTSLHKFGQLCNNIYVQMQEQINETLGTDDEIIFTSNATEANNLGIFGIIGNRKGKLITTKIEHPSVFEVFKHFESLGYEVVYLDVDKNGIIDLEQLKNEMSKDVILVSIMWVNNIVGSIQPIKKVIEIVKKYPRCKFHCDMVQGICKINNNFEFNDIDLFTISAHKFYGPKGIGCLIYKKNLNLEKRLYGSSSQKGLKPGTFDLGLIVCCAKALKKYFNNITSDYSIVKEINNYFRRNLFNNNIIINSSIEGSPYIINLSIPNILGETVVHKLEEKNIYISTGSACASKIKKPEKTVFAMTKNTVYANTTIRISFSHLTKFEEVDELLKVLNKL